MACWKIHGTSPHFDHFRERKRTHLVRESPTVPRFISISGFWLSLLFPNYIPGWWEKPYPSEKWWSSPVGMIFHSMKFPIFLESHSKNSTVPDTTNQVSMKTFMKSAGISRSHLASPWRWSRLLCPARNVPSPRARRVLHGATGSDLALPCAARRTNGGFWTIQGATSWRIQNMNGMGYTPLRSFTGWWLTYPSEKYESKSVGMMKFPVRGKKQMF